jgi:hypothetical protein
LPKEAISVIFCDNPSENWIVGGKTVGELKQSRRTQISPSLMVRVGAPADLKNAFNRACPVNQGNGREKAVKGAALYRLFSRTAEGYLRDGGFKGFCKSLVVPRSRGLVEPFGKYRSRHCLDRVRLGPVPLAEESTYYLGYFAYNRLLYMSSPEHFRDINR